uniref:Uncharacterized protein n=1 Tax=Chromera velia CCMP2878 TaxID=1169474 RepID=A0A0G4HQJ6_9ALVE|eukprot:Cvel_7944.t1-p1 / transcript=Cvel_7944.t1 / gene=Cvel_7944 / organism=Chromera_velia_CCMP2878 / gene_product=hypothetical protein / transcript_product=hypothetical protein / location=Cvel_scaffold426:73219-78749(-) / protein_length=1555 / sequence_SO=supercontig / SO=protein_coding / is_pseudo=false
MEPLSLRAGGGLAAIEEETRRNPFFFRTAPFYVAQRVLWKEPVKFLDGLQHRLLSLYRSGGPYVEQAEGGEDSEFEENHWLRHAGWSSLLAILCGLARGLLTEARLGVWVSSRSGQVIRQYGRPLLFFSALWNFVSALCRVTRWYAWSAEESFRKAHSEVHQLWKYNWKQYKEYLRWIQEIELTSRGFALAPQLPPISRIERSSIAFGLGGDGQSSSSPLVMQMVESRKRLRASVHRLKFQLSRQNSYVDSKLTYFYSQPALVWRAVRGFLWPYGVLVLLQPDCDAPRALTREPETEELTISSLKQLLDSLWADFHEYTGMARLAAMLAAAAVAPPRVSASDLQDRAAPSFADRERERSRREWRMSGAGRGNPTQLFSPPLEPSSSHPQGGIRSSLYELQQQQVNLPPSSYAGGSVSGRFHNPNVGGQTQTEGAFSSSTAAAAGATPGPPLFESLAMRGAESRDRDERLESGTQIGENWDETMSERKRSGLIPEQPLFTRVMGPSGVAQHVRVVGNLREVTNRSLASELQVGGGGVEGGEWDEESATDWDDAYTNTVARTPLLESLPPPLPLGPPVPMGGETFPGVGMGGGDSTVEGAAGGGVGSFPVSLSRQHSQALSVSSHTYLDPPAPTPAAGFSSASLYYGGAGLGAGAAGGSIHSVRSVPRLPSGLRTPALAAASAGRVAPGGEGSESRLSNFGFSEYLYSIPQTLRCLHVLFFARKSLHELVESLREEATVISVRLLTDLYRKDEGIVGSKRFKRGDHPIFALHTASLMQMMMRLRLTYADTHAATEAAESRKSWWRGLFGTVASGFRQPLWAPPIPSPEDFTQRARGRTEYLHPATGDEGVVDEDGRTRKSTSRVEGDTPCGGDAEGGTVSWNPLEILAGSGMGGPPCTDIASWHEVGPDAEKGGDRERLVEVRRLLGRLNVSCASALATLRLGKGGEAPDVSEGGNGSGQTRPLNGLLDVIRDVEGRAKEVVGLCGGLKGEIDRILSEEAEAAAAAAEEEEKGKEEGGEETGEGRDDGLAEAESDEEYGSEASFVSARETPESPMMKRERAGFDKEGAEDSTRRGDVVGVFSGVAGEDGEEEEEERKQGEERTWKKTGGGFFDPLVSQQQARERNAATIAELKGVLPRHPHVIVSRQHERAAADAEAEGGEAALQSKEDAEAPPDHHPSRAAATRETGEEPERPATDRNGRRSPSPLSPSSHTNPPSSSLRLPPQGAQGGRNGRTPQSSAHARSLSVDPSGSSRDSEGTGGIVGREGRFAPNRSKTLRAGMAGEREGDVSGSIRVSAGHSSANGTAGTGDDGKRNVKISPVRPSGEEESDFDSAVEEDQEQSLAGAGGRGGKESSNSTRGKSLLQVHSPSSPSPLPPTSSSSSSSTSALRANGPCPPSALHKCEGASGFRRGRDRERTRGQGVGVRMEERERDGRISRRGSKSFSKSSAAAGSGGGRDGESARGKPRRAGSVGAALVGPTSFVSSVKIAETQAGGGGSGPSEEKRALMRSLMTEMHGEGPRPFVLEPAEDFYLDSQFNDHVPFRKLVRKGKEEVSEG